MNFIDTLRHARESRVAILHEFWTQYDPRKARLHAFFEGHDDIAFFGPHIERLLPQGIRLVPYRCEGKPRVFEAFSEITARLPDIREALFFVDKDLDDILGVPWPTDPRIFVTDTYSVENYIVNAEVLLRLYRDGLRLTSVAFDEGVIATHFETQLARFHRQLLSVMAWIVLVRRAGRRPNLNNVDVGSMWRITQAGDVRPHTGQRLQILTQSTGARMPLRSVFRLREVARELARLPPKRIVRGKYEAWFLLEFWKRLVSQVQTLAAEKGGKVNIKIRVDRTNLVATVASYVQTPRPLELFLRTHFQGLVPSFDAVAQRAPPSRTWWQRVWAALTAG